MRRRALPAWWQKIAGYARWTVDGTCGRPVLAEFRLFGWWPGVPVPTMMQYCRATQEYFNNKLRAALLTPVFPCGNGGETYEWLSDVSDPEHYPWSNREYTVSLTIAPSDKEAP